ncbi:hypothetical protein [Robertkochia aurantiaca]|uniref:hypothetical protein n=1 Tax=Robertkochia aurantiaca TaxID=2873700 RepID=UPI001CCE7C6A|nr:hypothetical protein [Robertkochia sp. 3YJGBD-33]
MTLKNPAYLIPVLLFSFFAASQENLEVSKGKLGGQWRTFYMATFNKDSLKDFEALATGGYIKYTYDFNKNLSAGGALYSSLNTKIQDLTKPDPTTGRTSRYEEGLFDLLNPSRDLLVILGEMYLDYHTDFHRVKVGRMKIKSPFLNGQDGRMIPTLVQGAWYTYSPGRSQFQFGVLNEIAPRSGSEFFSIGESIGIYPSGRTLSGAPSMYEGNTNSDYVIIASASMPLGKGIKTTLWNYYTDNVFNTFYLKPEFDLSKNWNLQLEWVHQNRVGEGGNDEEALRYFTANTSDVIGTRLAYSWNRSSLSLAWNHILPHGQFLFPREWGREFIFSFQKRERSEGSADNHSLVLYYDQRSRIERLGLDLQSIISVGRHWKAPVTNPELNKYAFPDYTHINLDLLFDIDGLKGLSPEVLITGKVSHGDFPDNPNFIFNKTDLLHVNLVLNYNF